MKIKILTLLFLVIGLICHAQKELFAINKKDSALKYRIAKGNFLRVKMLSGEKYSGTFIKATDYEIILMRYSANVDIEEISYIKVLHEKGGLILLPPGGVIGYSTGRYGYFKARDWKFVIKEG